MAAAQQQHGPPYPPRAAGVGGLPSTIPDVPVAAVLLAIYIPFAITNMTIFQKNKRRNYKFFGSVFTFGFCMARVATLVLRIAWSERQHNVRLAIAANVFVNAGVLILYVLNLVYARRILKAEQPMLGWNPALGYIFAAFFIGIGAALIMVITSAVLSVYTLNPSTLQSCRDIQLAAGTYLLIFTTLPLFLLATAQASTSAPKENFGQGSMRTKKVIVAATSCLAVTIAGFKCGTSWMPPRPANNPAWYHSKPAFYIFNFALEITILAIYTLTRQDKRFYVPDGSKKAGDYARLSGRTSRDSEEGGGEKEISAK